MENQPNSFGELFESAGDYLETRIDLLKLQAVSKSSEVTSSVVSSIVITIVSIFTLLFLSGGLGFWLGELWGSNAYGFLAVGGFYLLVTLLILAFKKTWLKAPISNMVITKFLN